MEKLGQNGANSTKIALFFYLSGTHTFVTCITGLTSRSFSIAREYWIQSWCTWGKSGVLLVKWWRHFKLTAGQLKLSFVLTNCSGISTVLSPFFPSFLISWLSLVISYITSRIVLKAVVQADTTHLVIHKQIFIVPLLSWHNEIQESLLATFSLPLVPF